MRKESATDFTPSQKKKIKNQAAVPVICTIQQKLLAVCLQA